ncbi:MAG: zinc-ribbon domain-containing protein [Oscillospiraceae bacterium]|jgi:membrane-bound ClpP family serine protease|nr:zinc-ribbon domain-containing protein [Oscillospiraceae bacterium]
MYCKKCGAELSDGAQFCSKCGSTQDSDMGASTQANTTYAQPQEQSQTRTASTVEQPKAIAALVLGILGMFAWLLPLAGFPITIVGLILSIIGLQHKKALAKAGLVLNIIGLVACIINSAIGAFAGAHGMLF